MKSIITVEKLEKNYKGKKVIHGISFEVKKGEILCFLGPNGALDESCNNLLLFWNYIIELLSDFLSSSKDEFMEFFKANADKNSLGQMIPLLTDNMKVTEDLFIVLDDFHCLTDSELLASFESFLNGAPENLHFVQNQTIFFAPDRLHLGSVV